MSIRILPIKYVKAARLFVVTSFTHDPKAKAGEEKQSQKWFSSIEEANQFVQANLEASWCYYTKIR